MKCGHHCFSLALLGLHSQVVNVQLAPTLQKLALPMLQALLQMTLVLPHPVRCKLTHQFLVSPVAIIVQSTWL